MLRVRRLTRPRRSRILEVIRLPKVSLRVLRQHPATSPINRGSFSTSGRIPTGQSPSGLVEFIGEAAMSTRFTLAVGACLALMTVMLGADARAQVIYFGAEGGWSNLEDQREKFNVAGAPKVKSRYDSGFAAGARVGYGWGPWRVGEEKAHRRNHLHPLNAGRGHNNRGRRRPHTPP